MLLEGVRCVPFRLGVSRGCSIRMQKGIQTAFRTDVVKVRWKGAAQVVMFKLEEKADGHSADIS